MCKRKYVTLCRGVKILPFQAALLKHVGTRCRCRNIGKTYGGDLLETTMNEDTDMRKQLPTKVEDLIEICGRCRRHDSKTFKFTSDMTKAGFWCSAEYCSEFRDGERPAGVLLTPEQVADIDLLRPKVGTK